MSISGAPAFLDRAALARRVREEEIRAVKSTEKRPFWCVASEELNRITGEWELSLRYSHADTEAEARMTYCRARCDLFGNMVQPYRVIAVARVIGYKALDDNGTKLVA